MPEPRPVPAELTPDFEPERYNPTPTRFATVLDQLEQTTIDRLMELARGGIGEP